MTSIPFTVEDLIVDCDAQGIRLLPADDGKLTIDAPHDALTPDLLSRLRTQKSELLAVLQCATGTAETNEDDVPPVCEGPCQRLDDHPFLQSCTPASPRWPDAQRYDGGSSCDPANDFTLEPVGPDDWPADYLDPDELTPCPRCGTLDQWQSIAGDLFATTPGRWHCMKCDPPKTARRLAETAARIRRRVNDRSNTSETT